MKLLYLALFLCSSFIVSAQKLVNGVVRDEKNNPVPGASVFLSNTSIGTRADDAGHFRLYIPDGKFDLIVSSVGFETWNRTIVAAEITGDLTIRLQIKAEEMETVVIEPYEKDGWAKWGKFFTDNFIGLSDNARNCSILNTEVIRFRQSKKTRQLTAHASAPLIIENKALGYTITYQLQTFAYDFDKHYLLYTGFPFFTQMEGTERKEKKWEQNRLEVYYGSMMHFMRTVYRNTLSQEGFEVRSLRKIPNNEKQRVRAAYASNMKTSRVNGVVTVREINKDSSDYYDRIMRQEDFQNVIGREILPGDSIAYAVNKTTAGMEFENYLLVIYKKKLAPLAYRQQFPKSSTAMQSQLVLVNGLPIEIEANGSYYNPADLMSMGYWAWSEKIANMLPFDFDVGSKK